ncbi:hypothetical protein ABTN05_20410, partial [Acinetobacter baumannii]
MTSPAGFIAPSDATVWQQNWTTNSQQGTSIAGNVSSAGVAVDPVKGYKVLRTPLYIDGDLNISAADQLRLLPSGTDP